MKHGCFTRSRVPTSLLAAPGDPETGWRAFVDDPRHQPETSLWGGPAAEEPLGLERLRDVAGVLMAHLCELVCTRGHRQAMALALLEDFASARGLNVAELLVLVPGAARQALSRVDDLIALAGEEVESVGPADRDWGERPLDCRAFIGEADEPRRWRRDARRRP